MSFIKTFIELYSPTQSDNFIKKIGNLVKPKSYKKNDIIIDLDQTPSKFRILTKGIVRSYIIDSKDKERIKALYTPISGFAPLTALITKTPSTYVFDCLIDCEILEIDFNDFKSLIKSDIEFALFYIKGLEKAHNTSENRIYDLSVLNASERYIKLKEKIPNIDNLIQQYHIASYLNITPIQLSRVRKKISSK